MSNFIKSQLLALGIVILSVILASMSTNPLVSGLIFIVGGIIAVGALIEGEQAHGK